MLSQAERPLKNTESIVLKKLWQDPCQEYMALAFNSGYAASTIKTDAIRMWRVFSDYLGEKIDKSNWKRALESIWEKDLVDNPEIVHQPPEQQVLAQEMGILSASKSETTGAKSNYSFHDEDGECGEIRWVGRSPLLAKIRQVLQADCRILSLVGITGIGKTSLALRLLRDETLWAEGAIARKIPLTRQSPTFETLAQAVLGNEGSPVLPQQDPEQSLRAVLHGIQTRPHLLVLDMVEEILQPDGLGHFRFIDPLYETFLTRVARESPMPSRLILTSQDQPPICPEGRYPDRWFQESLKGLTEAECFNLFQRWEIPIRAGDEPCLRQIIQVYEGHPLALRVIIGDLRTDYQGDLQHFWQEHGAEITEILRSRAAEPDLATDFSSVLYHTTPNLVGWVRRRVEKTFQRLERDHPIAFELICQGSIFHQAVERERWLKRIRQYPVEQQIQAFAALQQRFLLEREERGHIKCYRLHSLIQSVARQYRERWEQEET